MAKSLILLNGITISRCVIVKSGIRRGGILSPLLLNIYIDSLILGLKSSGLGCYMRGLFVGCIAYALSLIHI